VSLAEALQVAAGVRGQPFHQPEAAVGSAARSRRSQSALAALPELPAVWLEAVAAPVRRARWVLTELLGEGFRSPPARHGWRPRYRDWPTRRCVSRAGIVEGRVTRCSEIFSTTPSMRDPGSISTQ
jgi:hypothetical protein